MDEYAKIFEFTKSLTQHRIVNGHKVQILQSEVNNPTRLSLDEVKNLVPPFNPASHEGLSAAQWIETIENIRMIYNWDDRLTLLYATVRLEDDARKWFNDNLCQWPVFKVKLVNAFPQYVNKGDVYEQLTNRRKDESESFEKYISDVEHLGRMCNFDLETTINYIISGLRDGGMRTHLIACNCKTISEVMLRIRSYLAVLSQEDLRNRLKGSTSEKCDTICYMCNKPGHLFRECKNYYDRKRRLTSSSEDQPNKTLRLENPVDNYADLVKSVQIGDIHVNAFVNLASDYTTMQLSEFQKHNWQMEQCAVKLRGFGQGWAMSIGRMSKDVGAGEVEMMTEILIVEDWVQEYPMVLGRNFLDKPQVCVIKKFGSLEIKFVDVNESNTNPNDDMEEEEVLKLLDYIERDYL